MIMENFWAGFGWVIGGLFAMVGFAVLTLFTLFTVSKWIDDEGNVKK